MLKQKHTNQILASLFSIFAFLFFIGYIIYTVNYYPFTLKTTFNVFMSFFSFAASLMLFLGVLLKNKVVLMLSTILFAVRTVIIALYSGIIDFFDNFFFTDTVSNPLTTFKFLCTLSVIVTFIFLVIYISGVSKIKKICTVFAVILWIFCVFEWIFSEFNPVVLILTAYILLLCYPDINNCNVRVNSRVLWGLTIITFGLYYIPWCISVIKKVNGFLAAKTTFLEKLLYILFPPYAAFWYYVKYEALNNMDSKIKNRGTLCLFVSLLFYTPLALCIMQYDLNSLAEEINIPEKENE